MKNRTTGFVATTAVVLLATGTLAFSLATISAVVSFADSVSRRELRIQARLNASSCLDSLQLMATRDYFLKGEIFIRDFGCKANIENDFNGDLNVNVETVLEGVKAQMSTTIVL